MRNLMLFCQVSVTSMLLMCLSLVPTSAQPQPSAASKRDGLLPQQLRIAIENSEEIVYLRYPDGWSAGQATANTWVILNVPADQQETVAPTVRVLIGYLERSDHDQAVSELAEYANESGAPSPFLAIGGWPASQRVQLVQRPQPSQGPPFLDAQMVQITTAVAVGNLLLRLEARLPSDADQQLKDLVLAIGQSLTFRSVGDPALLRQDLEQLNSAPRRPKQDSAVLPLGVDTGAEGAARDAAGPSIFPLTGAEAAGLSIFPLTQLGNLGTQGELEVAVSNNATNIVVVKQFAFSSSNDGGNTFPNSGGFGPGDGDSSVAFGQSGAFYVAGLFGNCPANNNCIGVTRSTDNGQTFPTANLVNGVVCPNTGTGACSTDQEHIAADRVNAGLRGGDRVYMGFRDLSGNANVTCSPDSNASSGAANTWAPRFPLAGGSDFPRVAVGSDGFFYVVYTTSTPDTIWIDKFMPCTTSAATMTRVVATPAFPRTVSALSNFAGCQVAGGFAGLDRCNNGNILSGPTVTVDDTNPNHIYVGWSNNTGPNNDNILVADSIDGGVTWGAAMHAPVTVNNAVNARRYHPWVCATGGNAFVTWYDRRAANAAGASNDLTDFFAAGASLSGGTLVPNNDEFQISAASDPQCNLWPTGPRSPFDSENCSVQPQNAGNCSITTTLRCDFTVDPNDGTTAVRCPTGETCQTDGFNTNPKYGDYNGNACILGRLYTTFASGAGMSSIQDFFQSFVVSSTPTTLTYTGGTTGDYHDPVTLSAVLTLSGTSSGVANQTITFTVGNQTCIPGPTDQKLTNASGFASCTLTLDQQPGLPYTVKASFAGAGLFQASSASKAFTITKEETTTTYTGPTVIANGVNTTFSAVLKEDGMVPISGRTIKITLGTAATAQTCTTGMTDASGAANCPILVNQPLGAGTVRADFFGDDFYLPSSDSAATILFAFLDQGAFVVGDQTAAGSAEFWGHDWSTQNVLTGGSAPDAFKGFAANTTEPPACGSTWTSRPGNSSDPPAGPLPAFMGVVVSSTVSKSGPTILGNVPRIVVVTPNPGYEPNPGHPGTGTVVATFCK